MQMRKWIRITSPGTPSDLVSLEDPKTWNEVNSGNNWYSVEMTDVEFSWFVSSKRNMVPSFCSSMLPSGATSLQGGSKFKNEGLSKIRKLLYEVTTLVLLIRSTNCTRCFILQAYVVVVKSITNLDRGLLELHPSTCDTNTLAKI
jgi:hypothetical protein